MAETGPSPKPFSQLSPAGKSQRKNPTKHRKLNRKLNKKPKVRAKIDNLAKERKKRGMGKAGRTGKHLGHTPSGKLEAVSRDKNSAANGSGNNSRFHTNRPKLSAKRKK